MIRAELAWAGRLVLASAWAPDIENPGAAMRFGKPMNGMMQTPRPELMMSAILSARNTRGLHVLRGWSIGIGRGLMSLCLSTFRPSPSTVGLSAIWNSMPSRPQRNRHTQCLIVLPDAPFEVMTYLNIPANMTFVLNWVGKKLWRIRGSGYAWAFRPSSQTDNGLAQAMTLPLFLSGPNKGPIVLLEASGGPFTNSAW